MKPAPPWFELRAGERLLWTGRPDPSVLFVRRDLLLVPSSLVWTGGVAWAVVGTLQRGGPVASSLGGLPFLLVGAYLVAGRFFVKRHTRRHTQYLLTDERAVVACGERTSHVELAGLTPALRSRRDQQHVTVTFGLGSRWFTPGRTGFTGLDFASSTWRQHVAFYDVADVAGLTRALGTARERSG